MQGKKQNWGNNWSEYLIHMLTYQRSFKNHYVALWKMGVKCSNKQRRVLFTLEQLLLYCLLYWCISVHCVFFTPLGSVRPLKVCLHRLCLSSAAACKTVFFFFFFFFSDLQQIEMATRKSVSWSLCPTFWLKCLDCMSGSLWNFVNSFGGFHISYRLQLQIKIQIMVDMLAFDIGDPFTFHLSPSSGPKMCPVLYSVTKYL